MKEHHILSLSGGKDSTALAFFIKENMPEVFKKLQFIFCDTECELPGTYEYLNKIELFLNKRITRIKPEKSFEHLMEVQNYFPSPARRWCTIELKTKPFKKFTENIFKQGVDVIYLYIGIRADELQRAKYNKYKDERIKEAYPFVDNSIVKEDILNILDNQGINLPDYYQWSNRSGCYFCPMQTKMNWLKLYENHPDYFKKAQEYEERKNPKECKFKRVGWNLDMSLEGILKNKDKIIASYKKRDKNKKNNYSKLIDIY